MLKYILDTETDYGLMKDLHLKRKRLNLQEKKIRAPQSMLMWPKLI
jgi:hypothetical protein